MIVGLEKDIYEAELKEKIKKGMAVNGNDEQDDRVKQKIVFCEQLGSISDEDVKFLKGIILKHDPNTVYLQNDLDYYDDIYNGKEDKSDPLYHIIAQIRNMRKTYKDVVDYCEALNVRSKYIDMIMKKYGGEKRFNAFYTWERIPEPFPHMPTLSKLSPDYDKFIKNNNALTYEPEELESEVYESLDELDEMRDVFECHFERKNDVKSDKPFVDICPQWAKEDYEKASADKIDFTKDDLNSLQDFTTLYRQWSYSETVKDKDVSEPLKYTYANVIKRENDRIFKNKIDSSILDRIREGRIYSDEENVKMQFDPNSMVREKDGRLTTWRDSCNRSLIKVLGQSGFNELALMELFNVGSNYEKSLKLKEMREQSQQGLDKEVYPSTALDSNASFSDLYNYAYKD